MREPVSDAELLRLSLELGSGPLRQICGWTHGLPSGYRQLLLEIVQELAARRLDAIEDEPFSEDD